MTHNSSGPTTAATVDEARKVDQLSSKITSENNVSAAVVKFHPLADIFPLEEFDALVADIKANGLKIPIALYQGKILDGRNRYRAYLAAFSRPPSSRVLYEIDPAVDGDAATYVISANIHRRHLTAEQKRELIAKLIKAQPEKSNRQIAKTAKVDHKTVSAERGALEATGEIPQLKKTVGADGKARKQPAKRKATIDTRKAAAAKAVQTKRRRAAEEQRCFNDKRDRVAAILIERLGREGALAVYHAMWAVGPRQLQMALKDTLDPDGNDGFLEVEDFVSRYSKFAALDDDAGNDPGPIPDCLRRVPKAVTS
jgi:hypothetical protein